ncbi:MAG: aminodeoxychorismate/anthranilate synthase component II [Gammaproteobacteria bacterium]|nr:aminodeoxychorismate/anthranilate synthase component II [Gammaproteobacteria bacterium]
MLLVDNYDSFTYNLVQAFLVLGADVLVYRNDEISVEQALELAPSHLCISPGPGRPDDAGVSLAMLAAFEQQVPILGVCLGHQSLVQHFGGRIISAPRLMHGKTSMITHDGAGVYAGLSQPFQAGRYHSLAAEEATMPAALMISSRSERGEIMGVRHRQLPVEGVQFHPESVLTPEGNRLLGNFLAMTAARR